MSYLQFFIVKQKQNRSYCHLLYINVIEGLANNDLDFLCLNIPNPHTTLSCESLPLFDFDNGCIVKLNILGLTIHYDRYKTEPAIQQIFSLKYFSCQRNLYRCFLCFIFTFCRIIKTLY